MMPPQATLDTLFSGARRAAERAYAPYSKFSVGAALLLADGSVITGCNVENASFGLTSCAERNALFRTIAERGPAIQVAAVAIANLNSSASPPCGACRQVLSEFVTPDAVVVFPGEGGLQLSPVPFSELFPFTFQLSAKP